MEKICGYCKIEKSLDEFYKHIRHKDGLDNGCKSCRKKIVREYEKKNYHILKEKRKEYRNAYNKSYRLKNPNYAKEYRLKNKDKIKEYTTKNKKRIREGQNKRINERFKTDPAFRAICRVRNRLIKIFKEKPKFSNKLGCSFIDFKKHIESLFVEGMTWDNFDSWQIDHHFPLSVAYKLGIEVFKKACHYTNLKPMWSKDNLLKGDSVPSEFLNEDKTINIEKFLAFKGLGTQN